MSEPIVRIAARGDGVTGSGRHVAGTAPGDVIAPDGSVTPGPHRNDPPCRHYGRCGGCQLQHIDDVAYAQFAVDRISGALKAQGVAVPDILPLHLSPPRTRRRVAMKAQRAGKRITIGFSESGSHALVDLAQCEVMRPELFALIAPLRALLAQLLADRKRCEIIMTCADQGIDLALAGVEIDGLAAAEALTGFATRHRLARLSVDEGYGLQPRYEPEPVTISLGGVAVPFPANAFLQATDDGEAALVAAVRASVAGAALVADLFAGLGTFTFAIDAPVHAAEGGREPIVALQTAARRHARPVTGEHRDLFRRPLTPAELARFDAVILDPPRAGAQAQAEALAASSVKRIAYVSCNPATFARDAALLIGGGYAFDWVQPVGQFRWSTHIELAGQFSRAG